MSLCDNPAIELTTDQEIGIEYFKKVLTRIAVKDVTPYEIPIRLI